MISMSWSPNEFLVFGIGHGSVSSPSSCQKDFENVFEKMIGLMISKMWLVLVMVIENLVFRKWDFDKLGISSRKFLCSRKTSSRKNLVIEKLFRVLGSRKTVCVFENCLCSRKTSTCRKFLLQEIPTIFRRLFPVSDEFSDEFRPLSFILTTKLETTIFTSCFWHKGHENDVF